MTNMKLQLNLLCTFLVTAALNVGAAEAQSSGITNRNAVSGSDAESTYWTPERMRNAKAAPTPVIRNRASARDAIPPGGKPQWSDGSPPEVEPTPADPGRIVPIQESAPTGVAPGSRGTSGIPFSTARVSPDSAVNTYPHRAAGKLFYVMNGGNWVCSASVIDFRVIITAAHCVYNTNTNTWGSNFLFVPSYNATLTTQPYGTWGWAHARVLNNWINLTSESYPNRYDFALIQSTDRTIGGTVRTLGGYVGWLGWHTHQLIGNHVTQIGYPTNLDSGGRMIRNDSQVFSANSGWNGEIGSAMFQGASGGPWVQDFGTIASGQTITSTGDNRVTGVSSYVFLDTAVQKYGATVLHGEFPPMLNVICARRPGNC